MGTALQKLEGICAEIYSRWDNDMRSGKLLSALAGGLTNYRQDVTDVRAALAENERLSREMEAARAALINVRSVLKRERFLELCSAHDNELSLEQLIDAVLEQKADPYEPIPT